MVHICNSYTERWVKKQDCCKFKASLVYLNSRLERVTEQVVLKIPLPPNQQTQNKNKNQPFHLKSKLQFQTLPRFDKAVTGPGR